MDAMDEKIVSACNVLLELKLETTRLRVDNSNDKARLKRSLEQEKRDWEGRIRSFRMTKDLTVYKESCAKVFEEAGIRIPALAAARQAQLCLHVHVMTAMENQLELLEKQLKKEMTALEIEQNRVRESVTEAEVRLLNGMANIQLEIQDFVDWTKEPLIKRKIEKKQKQQQAQELEKQQQKLDQVVGKITTSNSLQTDGVSIDQQELSLTSSSSSKPAQQSPLLMTRRQSTGNTNNGNNANMKLPKKSSQRAGIAVLYPTTASRRQSTGTMVSLSEESKEEALVNSPHHQEQERTMGEGQSSASSFSLRSNSVRMMMPSRPSSLSKISIH